jgi:phospholipid-binding lipoprotein MlaA
MALKTIDRCSRGILVLLATALLLLHPLRLHAQMAPEPLAVDGQPDELFDQVGDDLDTQGQGFPDPLEPLNRKTLVFNQGVDRFILNPITTVYRFIVPEPGRRAVRRVLANLESPATLVNDVLQLEFKDAGVTTARFLVNSTVGLAGIFDVGNEIGLPPHRSDFGQTLARAGVGSGPFLILPVLGPSTARDGAGTVVDAFLHPTLYVLGPVDQVIYSSIHGGSAGIALFDQQADNLQQLEESSVDYYAALRSAYYQNRIAQIRGDDVAPGSVAIAVQ